MPTYNQIQYRKNKKKVLIKRWIKTGLIHSDYNELYDNYELATNCEKCGVLFGVKGDKTGTHKCMDHNHTTGLFRSFLCNYCNCLMDKTKNKNNSSGYPNVMWRNVRSRWGIQIRRYGKSIVNKSFKSYYEAVIYRWLLKELYNI